MRTHGFRRVIVLMEHTAPGGVPKLLRECSLPLTGQAVVNRVITELCVLDVTAEGFSVVGLAPGVTQAQVTQATGAPVSFTSESVLKFNPAQGRANDARP